MGVAKGKNNSCGINEIVLIVRPGECVREPSHEIVDLCWTKLNPVGYRDVEPNSSFQCKSIRGRLFRESAATGNWLTNRAKSFAVNICMSTAEQHMGVRLKFRRPDLKLWADHVIKKIALHGTECSTRKVRACRNVKLSVVTAGPL